MSEPPSTHDYASPPFNHPKADLILLSCDGVDFRVSKFILGVSSDFFATMFEAGQAPGDELRDGCPIVPVQEDSGTLNGPLRIIYPTITPDLDKHPNRDAILEAALKYDMKEANRVSTSSLRSLAPKTPLRIWIVAVRNRLEPETRVTASELLRQRISVLDEDVTEMGQINAGQYFRLLRYMRLLGKVEAGFTFCDPRPEESDNGSPPSALAGSPQPVSQIYERLLPFADITHVTVCLQLSGS